MADPHSPWKADILQIKQTVFLAALESRRQYERRRGTDAPGDSEAASQTGELDVTNISTEEDTRTVSIIDNGGDGDETNTDVTQFIGFCVTCR